MELHKVTLEATPSGTHALVGICIDLTRGELAELNSLVGPGNTVDRRLLDALVSALPDSSADSPRDLVSVTLKQLGMKGPRHALRVNLNDPGQFRTMSLPVIGVTEENKAISSEVTFELGVHRC